MYSPIRFKKILMKMGSIFGTNCSESSKDLLFLSFYNVLDKQRDHPILFYFFPTKNPCQINIFFYSEVHHPNHSMKRENKLSRDTNFRKNEEVNDRSILPHFCTLASTRHCPSAPLKLTNC